MAYSYTSRSRTRGYTGGSYSGYTGSFSGAFSGSGGYSSSPRRGSGLSSSSSGYSSSGGQGSLLQNVISKLEDSMDDDERKQHYKEVQDDLEIEEDRVETLVKDNQEKLQSTLSTFGKIDATIRESQIKVRMLKDNLLVCKTQLRCKRDELKRLWLDEVKFKQMLKIVDQVETIRGVPAQLAQLRANKQYLEATEKLQNTVAMLDGSLSGIDALKELKTELKQQKENFHYELIKELQRHLYTQTEQQHTERQQPPQPHLLRTPQQSIYRAHSPSTPSSPPTNTKRQTVRHTRSSSKSGNTESSVVTTPATIEETEGSEPKDSVASLVDALAMLHKIPDMLEAVQQHMNQELVLIVERAALHIIKKGSEEGIPPHLQPSAHCDHSKYLLEMLNMCFKQFKAIVNSHSHLLDLLESSKKGYGESYELYTERDVWACIQQVLRSILEVYLAVDEDKGPQTAMSSYSPFMIGGHEFSFLRRKTHTRRKQTLFRFDNSRHALSISSYMKEQRDHELSANAGSGGMFDDNQPSISQHLVCRPCTRNITVMYGPMKEFVLKIEDAQQIQDGDHCDLFHFLQNFVEQRFLDCIQAEYNEKLDNSIKFEARQALTLEAKVLKPTNKLALHSSALVLWQSVQELHQLMEDLPMYSSHFLSIMLLLLQSYQDSSYTFYCDLTSVSHDKGHHGDKHSTHRGAVVSAIYARDGDINRLLRSMVSWHRHTSPTAQAVRVAHEAPGIGKDSMYAKESHNLLNGLGKDVSARQHVLHDHDNIKQLAVLHESMEWFAHNLKQLSARLAKWQKEFSVETDGASMSKGHCSHASEHEDDQVQEREENQVQTRNLLDQLSKVVSDLTSLSETTLIMLHLELRAHCCYYLLPTLKQSIYVCEDEVSEVDQGVKDIAVDLTNMRTIMAGVMTQDKQRYLFDGIGHLIAAIFITSTQYIQKININGVKKMCRNIQHMQSCLSKITSIRERDLDLAQKYFTMLYVNEEEFLKLVMEEGKQFARDDYANALRLLARSQPNYNEIRLQNNLDRLEKMFASDAC